ncbi:hypothetical protein ACFQBS_28625 [Planomonospora parontospora]|uniref:hypothetical protein n=1 Tax=Planomonospora parontospora TaxID=58119 RepID=UPI00361FE65D
MYISPTPASSRMTKATATAANTLPFDPPDVVGTAGAWVCASSRRPGEVRCARTG